MTDHDCDVLIAGGGPAGSTLATLLAQAGLKTVLLEAEHFPRHHIGESLVPAVMSVLEQTGALGKVATAGFPIKRGACWTTSNPFPRSGTGQQSPRSGTGQQSPQSRTKQSDRPFRHVTMHFGERARDDAEVTYTYHVERARFDLMLLQHAAEQGAIVMQGVRAIEPRFDADGVTVTARAGGPDGVSWPIRARMLADATGRATLLGSQLKLKVKDPVFDQYATYTWFEGLDRAALTPGPDEADYIAIHFLPDRNAWIWQIPISDTVTSVGVVAQKSLFKEHGGDREGFFWKMVGLRPELEAELRKATVADRWRTEGDYSYSMRQICGDRYVMVGDAARFVDPIFSSGVSIALQSARFAAADIVAGFESGDLSRAAFTSFETTVRRGVRNWYEFISLYYRLNILFTAFTYDKRYRTDLIKLLQGDLYDDDAPPALVAMRRVVNEVEHNPDHIWHPYLGSLKTSAPLL
ncbi:MAG: NAD(P)/FAD-dependent oxidoreductase [Micromonosporaceae bacterium]